MEKQVIRMHGSHGIENDANYYVSEPITGYLCDYSTVVHRQYVDDPMSCWTVTDMFSGYSLATGDTRKSAIETLHEREKDILLMRNSEGYPKICARYEQLCRAADIADQLRGERA